MLVLTQRIGDKVIIKHGEIEVKILEIKGRQVSVGYTADKSIPVNREVIEDRIREQSNANV